MEHDLCVILKDCPKGIKLYSPVIGYGRIKRVTEETIEFVSVQSSEQLLILNRQGMSTDSYNGECLLFPTKEKTWENWEEKLFIEGVYIVSKSNGEVFFCSSLSMIYDDCGNADFIKNYHNYRFASVEEIEDFMIRIKKNGCLIIGKNIVKVSRIDVKKDEWYTCISDYHSEFDDGFVYKKGNFYKSEKDGCITDEYGNIDHAWSPVKVREYFKRWGYEDLHDGDVIKLKLTDDNEWIQLVKFVDEDGTIHPHFSCDLIRNYFSCNYADGKFTDYLTTDGYTITHCEPASISEIHGLFGKMNEKGFVWDDKNHGIHTKPNGLTSINFGNGFVVNLPQPEDGKKWGIRITETPSGEIIPDIVLVDVTEDLVGYNKNFFND